MNQEETMLKHKERYKKTIKNLTVMSDIFAKRCTKNTLNTTPIHATAQIVQNNRCALGEFKPINKIGV